MDRAPRFAQQIREEVLRRWVTTPASRIVETIENERAPMRSLETLIKARPVFAARLVLLANLANSPAPRLTEVSQATSALGLDYIKPLILALLAYEAKPLGPSQSEKLVDPDPTTLRDLWEHALASAMIAAKIDTELANVSPLQAFTAGLIHDVGRVLLWRHSNVEFAAAVALARQQQLPIGQAESSAIGIDHAAMGDAWCGKCEIAAPLAELVRRHDEPMTALNVTAAAGVARLIAIVQAAESLSETAPLGLNDEGLPACADGWSSLGLSKAEWTETQQIVKADIETLRDAFGFRRFDRAKPDFYRREIFLPTPPAPEPTPTSNPSFAGRGRVIRFPMSVEAARRFEARTPAEKLVLLVVEDHGTLCEMVSVFLMRCGYQVRTASNGVIALEILAREEIHMVLLDLMLPRVDGFAVLRQIHESRQEMLPYIIVVSAGASDHDRKKVLDLGANEYLPKPFPLARLLERVRAVEKYLL
jgi:CheY-like chemotaxis protein/HD-like signal output (HDOD) protein